MGNCQQQTHQQKIFDDKHTVDSQDYPRSANNKQSDQHLQPVEKSKINKKKEQQQQAQSQTYLNDSPYTFIRRPAPNFSGVAYQSGFKKVSLRDFKGQYVVLFFFPYDFSEMCRKEILAFSDLNDKFQKAACQVIGCSQDSQFAHMNYCQKKRSEGGLGNLEIPLLSDVDRQISTSYGVVIEDGEAGEKGASYRSTFIIDQHLILRHMSINDIAISVNPEEVLRLVYTFQQNDRENPLKGAMTGGCPFAAHAKEMQSNQDIDTFSRYQRKKSDDGSNKNESAKQNNSEKKSSSRNQPQKNDEKVESLIIRLGGDEVIQDIADKFVSYVFSDPLLKPFFLNISNQSKQKKSIGQFLKTYFGSPSLYLGKNMRDAHKDLNLNDDHFNKASDYFKTILKDMNVKPPLIQEVMMLIEPLRSQITQKPSQSLYNRVNREAGIKKAVQFYFNKILQINEIKPYYSKVDQEKIQESYVQYLSLVFGGPAKYKGKQMKDAHVPLHIPERIFNFCLLQIQHAFKENGVDTNSFHEIGRLLECLRSEIPKKNNTLFDRLGGQVVIEKSIRKIYEEKIMNEPKIKEFFKGVDMKQLGQKMTDFYIMITGGHSKYQGKSAKDAHKSFNIMSNQFDIYKNLLRDTFLECGSTKESVQEFMNLIETIKIDVIGGKPPSLYEKIGGDDTVTHFSEKLFEKIMEEKKIRHYFINVDLKSVKMHFREFMLMATGGPSKYQGQNIRDMHEQMDISEKDFNVFMDVVKDTIGVIKIKEELQSEVSSFFESMRQMIVTVDD